MTAVTVTLTCVLHLRRDVYQSCWTGVPMHVFAPSIDIRTPGRPEVMGETSFKDKPSLGKIVMKMR